MTAEMKLKRMSEIELQEVEWLWYPYIPFGKITIIQGDPGEGKTTLGLRLAAPAPPASPFLSSAAFPGFLCTSCFSLLFFCFYFTVFHLLYIQKGL